VIADNAHQYNWRIIAVTRGYDCYAPPSKGALMAIVFLSVCLVPDPKSKMERRNELKFGRKEDYETGDL